MLTLLICTAIACFVGVVILGHILLLQALFVGMAPSGGNRVERKTPAAVPRAPA